MSEIEKEIILGIEETHVGEDSSWDKEAGFCIVTDKQEILFLIDDSSSCCETWGYFITEDDPEKFVGAAILEIEVVDANRSTRHVFTRGWDFNEDDKDKEYIHLDSGDTMFVDIRTSEGVFQLVAYNSHNGYYGHSAKIISKQVNETKTL